MKTLLLLGLLTVTAFAQNRPDPDFSKYRPTAGALLANTYDAKGRWTGTVNKGLLPGAVEIRDTRGRVTGTVSVLPGKP